MAREERQAGGGHRPTQWVQPDTEGCPASCPARTEEDVAAARTEEDVAESRSSSDLTQWHN